MFEDAFIKLGKAECEKVLAEINPQFTGGQFSADKVTILAYELPFYQGYRFLDIGDYETTPHLRKFAIYKPGDVIVLDWTNRPIYELNKAAPLVLNVDTVTDYIRFFFSYVHGQYGRFIPVENVDDIAWNDDPPPAARKAVGSLLHPVTVHGCDKESGYRISGCFMYGNTLYKANIRVGENGEVTLSDEEVLVDDLPVVDDVLQQ